MATAVPIVLCGRSAAVARPVIAGVAPEYEGIRKPERKFTSLLYL